MDPQPVLRAALGGPCRRHHPEHVRDDLHRGEHSSLRADYDPGSAGPDSWRVRRRIGPGRDRQLRHQGRLALRARFLWRGLGERATVEIQARGGVLPGGRHDHPRSRPSQGRRGATRRAALVPGHARRDREFAGSCLCGRRLPDVHRPVLECGVRLRHQPGDGGRHLRRPSHHDHVWKLHRFGRNPLSAVGQSCGPVASGRHVSGGVQRADLRGARPADLLRDPLRHPVDEGVGSRHRSGPGPAAGPYLRFSLRVPVACDAPRAQMVGLGSRAAVADLTGRRTVTAAIHSRPCLRGRRHVPRARRPGAEACNERPVPVLRCSAPGGKDRPSARFHSKTALRHHGVPRRSSNPFVPCKVSRAATT